MNVRGERREYYEWKRRRQRRILDIVKVRGAAEVIWKVKVGDDP